MGDSTTVNGVMLLPSSSSLSSPQKLPSARWMDCASLLSSSGPMSSSDSSVACELLSLATAVLDGGRSSAACLVFLWLTGTTTSLPDRSCLTTLPGGVGDGAGRLERPDLSGVAMANEQTVLVVCACTVNCPVVVIRACHVTTLGAPTKAHTVQMHSMYTVIMIPAHPCAHQCTVQSVAAAP